MGKEHDRLGLRSVSDKEWLNEVPDELLDPYMRPWNWTKEEMVELKKQFPKWFRRK